MARRKSKLREVYTAEYNALKNAIHRTERPNNIAWENYGARGITVTDEWKGKNGFALFLDHIGPRPTTKHSLDRIDNNKGYEPGNVWWAPNRKFQAMNRRPIITRVKDLGWGIGYTAGQPIRGRGPKQSALVPHNGKLRPLSELAEELNMCAATIRQRLQRGLSPEQALNPSTSRKGETRSARPTIH